MSVAILAGLVQNFVRAERKAPARLLTFFFYFYECEIFVNFVVANFSPGEM